jgi:hypothetical protein
MSESKKKEETKPSMNPEEKPGLQDYRSKEKRSSSDMAKRTDFDSITTVPTPEGDVQLETRLEVPLENDKENVKSETKSPKVKTLSEEEPSITTVSKEELSEKSSESASAREYQTISPSILHTPSVCESIMIL